MLRFETIASGSTGNAYVLREDGAQPLLLEAGLPVRQLQQALNHQASSLGAIVLSHAHGDHAKGAAALAHKASVPVVANAATASAIGLPTFRHRRCEAGDRVNILGWIIRAFPLEHDVPNNGYHITSPRGETLVFITDTRTVPHKFRNINVLAIEANHDEVSIQQMAGSRSFDAVRAHRIAEDHMSLETAELFIKQIASDSPNLREIHLLHLSDSNSNAQAFKERVERLTGVPVRIAPRRATQGETK